MGKSDGGFINERTGAYVSEERAHQHVGEEHAFGGYEKAVSKKTGNFYMRETTDDFDPISTAFAGILSRDGRSGQR
ncbi:MAG: hypothetical protein HFJ74_08715 [Eggerthellaceae bacterium]|nr:hypothetical protein [Eggerthellaceae bacterium]